MSLIQFLHDFLIHYCLHIAFITIFPALLCKYSAQSGNTEQCTLVFIHLLSMHKSGGIASCIVSVSSLIQVLSSIVCFDLMVQLVPLCFIYSINVQSLYLNSIMIHFVHHIKVNNDWEANHM